MSEIHSFHIPPSIKINVIIDDLHHQGQIKYLKQLGLERVDRIFSTYGYAFGKFYSMTKPVYFLPHAATFPINFNPCPTNRILLSGRIIKDIYPFRNLIHKLSKKLKNSIDYLNVNFNYRLKYDNPTFIYGERYIQRLNSYLACFTCDASEHRPYIVAKHFEILASGSLLLAANIHTKIYLEHLGLIDGIHYISVNMTNIEEKIQYVLDPANRSTIDSIRFAGYEMANKFHFFPNRAEFLAKILDNNVEMQIQVQTDGLNGSTYLMEMEKTNPL